VRGAGRVWNQAAQAAHERDLLREGVQMAWTMQVREFVKEVKVESTKVSWPTRQELRASTTVVIVAVLLISVFVGVVDYVLQLGVRLLFR
jgi:preprotein translocase subunit SecE